MEKWALNQKILPKEKERAIQVWCPYLVQAKSNVLHHIQKIWAWGAQWSLPKMEKCMLNQQKLPRERERDTQVWCPYLFQAKSNFPHHIQKIWAWVAQGSLPNMEKCTLISKYCPDKGKRHPNMSSIPFPGQVKLSPPHAENLGMKSPGVSAKSGKMWPKSAKIAQREGKRHQGIVPIPWTGQIQLSPLHTENLGMGSPGVSTKYGKMHPKSANIAQRKGKNI